MASNPPDIQKVPSPAMPSQRWLAVARIGWGAITLATLLLFAASLPYRYDYLVSRVDLRPLLELEISAASYATYVIALDVIVVLVHIAIATFIFFRRPNDWIAMFVSITLVTNGSILPLAQLFEISGVNPLWLYLDRVVIFVGMVSSIILLYIFPDGRFIPRGTRLLALTWAALMFFAIFTPGSILSMANWHILLQFVVVTAWAGTGLFAQVFRYENVSRPIERQQTKWALFGLFAATVGPVLVLANFQAGNISPAVPNVLYQRMGSGFFTLSFLVGLAGLTVFKLASLLFPISFAIAVLRYRLWDIDIIIRRTLIYAALSGALVLVYLSSIVFLQEILSVFTQASQLAIVISTLATAALINPLRRRIQNGIDRRFYRNRYDAEKILAAFSASLRDQVDLEQLKERLLVVVEDSMYPESVSLWLAKQKLSVGESKGENNS